MSEVVMAAPFESGSGCGHYTHGPHDTTTPSQNTSPGPFMIKTLSDLLAPAPDTRANGDHYAGLPLK